MNREELLQNRIKEKYHSIRQFSIAADIPVSTLASMFKKGIGGTAFDTLIAVCNLLDFDVSVLCPEAVKKENEFFLSEEEKDFIRGLRSIDGEGRELVRMMLRRETQHRENTVELSCVRTLPIYDIAVSAGSGQFADDSSYDMIEVPDGVPESATFALRISGNSMEPRIHDRQIVWVRETNEVQNGEVGVFILNGDAYCKKMHNDCDGVRLVSYNKDYNDIAVTEFDEFLVMGKVLKATD